MRLIKFFLFNFFIAYERKYNIITAWKDAIYITKILYVRKKKRVEITFNCECVFDNQYFRKGDRFIVPSQDALKLSFYGIAKISE